MDAETIAVAYDACTSLGLRQFTLLLNSLGDNTCRPVYREALQKFLRGLDLDEETRKRIELNPLRVLDDKRPQVREQLENAPPMTDYLCADCTAHHETVRGLLAGLGIPFTEAPRLVRGLDYYNGPPMSSTTRCSAPSQASAAVAGMTGSPRTSAGRRCLASGSLSAWTV